MFKPSERCIEKILPKPSPVGCVLGLPRKPYLRPSAKSYIPDNTSILINISDDSDNTTWDPYFIEGAIWHEDIGPQNIVLQLWL